MSSLKFASNCQLVAVYFFLRTSMPEAPVEGEPHLYTFPYKESKIAFSDVCSASSEMPRTSVVGSIQNILLISKVCLMTKILLVNSPLLSRATLLFPGAQQQLRDCVLAP